MPRIPIEKELDFLEVQIRVLQDTAHGHYRRSIGETIARLHKRMDELVEQKRRRTPKNQNSVKGNEMTAGQLASLLMPHGVSAEVYALTEHEAESADEDRYRPDDVILITYEGEIEEVKTWQEILEEV